MDQAFLEKFVLAEDRKALLKELVPNSHEHHFYNALYLQTAVMESAAGSAEHKAAVEALKEADKLISDGDYHGRLNGHGEELRLRQHLLRYASASKDEQKKTCDYLRNRFNLYFSHTKRVEAYEAPRSTFPTKLDPKTVDLQKVLLDAWNRTSSSVSGFTPLAWNWLAQQKGLDYYRLPSFLGLLDAPIVPDLIALLARDMKEHKDETFGRHNVHHQLTLAQLKELEKAVPSLSSSQSFVTAVLRKHQPTEPVDQLDAKAKAEFYQSTWEYAAKLPAQFNSLKSSMWQHVLNFKREIGAYDFDGFQKWLELPRNSYPHNNRFSGPEYKLITVHWASATSAGVLPANYDESGLIREYCSEWFRRADVKGLNIDKFSKYLDKDFLLTLLAETKVLLNGAAKVGAAAAAGGAAAAAAAKEAEEYFNRLGTSRVAELKTRVDLEFDRFANPKRWAVGDDVVLNVWTKNVPVLMVKLFRINARAYYRANLREVDASINLDGLTALYEHTLRFEPDGPNGVDSFQRVRRALPFPQLKGARGVWVVEVLGNGKFSRAVIRKGQLSFLENQMPNGHVFRVLDENGQAVAAPTSIWLGGHTYTSNPDTGLIMAPYAASTKYNEPLIISASYGSGAGAGADTADVKGASAGAAAAAADADEFTCLSRFTHQSEVYTFAAGLFVDRESLLAKSQTELLIRPALYLNGNPTPLGPIKKATLRINTTNDEGVNSSQVLNDFKLATDGKDTVHTVSVPENLRRLTFQLDVEVRVSSTGATSNLSANSAYELNRIDDTDRLDDLHLRFGPDGYSVSLLGKSGEARPHQRVTFTLYHTYVTSSLHADLQTDETGRVALGPLPNISRIVASAEHGGARADWTLALDYNTPRALIHAVEGDTIRIPYIGAANQVNAENFALLERRHGGYQEDVTAQRLSLSLAERSLLTSGLPRGEYELRLKEFLAPNDRVTIVVAKGEVVLSTYVMEKTRFVELRSRDIASLQIADVKADANSVEVQLAQFTPTARVHVLSTHFYPEYSAIEQLSKVRGINPRVYPITRLESVYHGAKDLGDEHQYILDRKLAKKYTGNMLPRPSLLLNERVRQFTSFDADPQLRGTQAFEGQQQNYGAYPSSSAAGAKPSPFNGYGYADSSSSGPTGQRNLEFLTDPSARVLNLPVDASGRVKFERSKLGAFHTQLTVIATDGLNATVVRRVPLALVGAAASKSASAGADAKKAAESKDAKGDVVLDPAYTDTRLLPGLSILKHFTEQYLISPLNIGDTKQVDDIRTATVETFETLGDVWALYATLAKERSSADAQLMADFNFVMEWPTLSAEQKFAKYSEFACHELNFFVYQKDRPFFDATVKPFLRDKLAKTFLDRWLLGLDLQSYTQPFDFRKLNAFEKILLAKALPKQTAFVSGFVTDNAALIQKDPQQFIALFKAALQSRALDDAKKGSSVPKQSREADRAMKADMRLEQEREMASHSEMRKQMIRPSAAPAPIVAAAAMAMPSAPMPRAAPMPAMRMMAAAAPMSSMSSLSGKKKESAKISMSMADDDDMASGGLPGAMGGAAGFGAAAASVAADPWAAADGAAPVRRLFQAPPTTKELEERNYYAVPSDNTERAAQLITNNQFWSDYAAHIADEKAAAAGKPFLSQWTAYAAGNFTEILLAIAVIDLPFKAAKHDVNAGRIQFRFKAASPALMFHREVKETAVVPSSVSVTQTYFDPADPFEEVDGERVDKYLDKEFLPSRVYGCRVVLTNVSSTYQKVAILKQVPGGSVGVSKYGRNGQCRAFVTRTEFADVQPFSTFVTEFFFYFPALGTFWHYPVHVSKTAKDGTKVVGHGPAREMRVVGKPTTPPDVTSWRYLSQNGSEQQVLQYLKTQNLYKIDVSEVAWRFRESEAFYRSALPVLRERMVYNATLWSYALHYNDAQALSELLPLQLQQYNGSAAAAVGPYFRSALLAVDAFRYTHNTYQHFEYAPLINARAHQLKSAGGNNSSSYGSSASAGLKATEIQNVQFRAQYQRFLQYLLYRSNSRAAMPLAHQLAATYYLLLQDRSDEAVRYFAAIDIKRAGAAGGVECAADAKAVGGIASGSGAVDTELQMQYDYLTCYLDFFSAAGPGQGQALAVAKKYETYPVAKKRALFREVRDQIFEATPNADVKAGSESGGVAGASGLEAGKREGGSGESRERDREMAGLAATEPALDVSVEAKSITVNYANVTSATLNFYVMDIELLFSTNPFISSTQNTKLFVSPNYSQHITLPKGQSVATVPMPAQFFNANIFVEVVGPGQGLTRVSTYYSNSLSVQVIENYGQVKVTDRATQRPLPTTYVKVYAKEKSGGAVSFYKDGYTDSRGRFDYASLSTSKLPNVERFALLVLTEGRGAVVREAAPPSS